MSQLYFFLFEWVRWFGDLTRDFWAEFEENNSSLSMTPPQTDIARAVGAPLAAEIVSVRKRTP
jgi:hypothetical protein